MARKDSKNITLDIPEYRPRPVRYYLRPEGCRCAGCKRAGAGCRSGQDNELMAVIAPHQYPEIVAGPDEPHVLAELREYLHGRSLTDGTGSEIEWDEMEAALRDGLTYAKKVKAAGERLDRCAEGFFWARRTPPRGTAHE